MSTIPSPERDHSYLVVRSGGACYALPAARVRHVVRRLACHPVPGGRSYLLGLAQFAGEPLAVLDLHSMVEGTAPQSRHLATVILGSGERESWTALGLAVNDAVRVVAAGEVVAEDPGGGVIAGSLTLGGDTVRVVNTARLFDGESVDPGGGDD